MSNKVRIFLKKDFLTVFLDVNLAILIKRLKNSKKRPLLINTNLNDTIKKLDIVRRKYYLEADLIISNCDNPDDTLETFFQKYNTILNKWKKI